jgi:hypothetical protein
VKFTLEVKDAPQIKNPHPEDVALVCPLKEALGCPGVRNTEFEYRNSKQIQKTKIRNNRF